ncbi:MAG: DUF4231 domain-containing protein [Cyanobacteria bacterium J06633_8]
MTTSELNNQMGRKHTQLESSSSSTPKMLSFLKKIEYLCFAVFLALGIISLVLAKDPRFAIASAIALAGFIFLFLVNQENSKVARENASQNEIQKKADLYLINNQKKDVVNYLISPARTKALAYAQELIDDYKKTRKRARNLYYILQIGTIVLSGVTPILVLVDKLQAGQTWLKWLPVIFPAVASIVASVVTSFPLQETWISANTTVELLEAEQEKFILGITPLYRCYDSANEGEQERKAKKSIENFITQVNNIHLNQVQETSATKTKEDKEEDKAEQLAEQPN